MLYLLFKKGWDLFPILEMEKKRSQKVVFQDHLPTWEELKILEPTVVQVIYVKFCGLFNTNIGVRN